MLGLSELAPIQPSLHQNLRSSSSDSRHDHKRSPQAVDDEEDDKEQDHDDGGSTDSGDIGMPQSAYSICLENRQEQWPMQTS